MNNIDYKARHAQLAALARERGVDAVLLVPGSNMLYFTGLHTHTSERPIIALFTADGMSIIIPNLETPKVDSRPDLGARVFGWGDIEGYVGAFQAALDTLGLRGKRLGIDGMTMRVTEWLTFQQLDPTLTVVPVERDLIGIRAHKQPDEIAAMRSAIRIAEQALEQLTDWVQPGMSEALIARRLQDEMIALGAEGLAFDTLIQSGPNSSSPHGTVTDRKVAEGDFLLIDYGCTVDGYPSDITRTFVIGTPTDEMKTIYDTVLKANEAARAVAGPGVPMEAVDQAARSVIEAAGYGQYFTHRTGHGLGLDVHEPIPQIATGVKELLEPGMTFTIEPGIYIPGLGGVRIEDNMLVTDSGVETMTSFPRDWRV